MLISKLVALSLSLGLIPSASSAACKPRDFMALPMPDSPGRSPMSEALELAYDGLTVNEADQTVTINGQTLALGPSEPRSVRQRLGDSSIADQFAQVYPLDFDLTRRLEPWFDPGRARNDDFFRSIYGKTEAQVAGTLQRAAYKGQNGTVRFAMSARQCVVGQLQAALDAIAAEGPDMDRFLENPGGSFNWRKIAGTQRLSAHSYGIAVDFNTQLGGYWRWDSASEGAVGDYNNAYPEQLVRHMERFGFIWGGKWHHYDGMHFEYRPELILHARRMAGLTDG